MLFKIIGTNLKLLRASYNLNQVAFASLFDFKSRDALARWETGKNGITIDKLVNISRYFAVSLNWLCGLSTNPYDQSMLLNLEKSICPLKINIEGKEVLIFPSIKGSVPSEYLIPETRHIYYSNGQRANIIFLLESLKHFVISTPGIISYHDESDSYMISYSEFDEKIMMNLYQLWFNSPKIGLSIDFAKNLPYDKPIYDLEAAIKNAK